MMRITIGMLLLALLAMQPTWAESANIQGKIYWPPPPATPRYAYVRDIRGEEEQSREGFLSGLSRLLFGEQPLRRFVRPHDIAISAQGRIFVTDPGAAGLHILGQDDDYRFIQQVGGHRLVRPIGVALTKQGDILLSDAETGMLYHLGHEGDKLAELKDRAWLRPTDIAVHPKSGDIYIVDTPAHCIYIYDSKLNKKGRLGKRGNGPSEFNYPTHLDFSAEGELYVTDSMNFRIQVFDRHNNPIRQFGKLGDRLGEFSKPKGIAVDRDNHVYVIDAQYNHLLIYDRQGRFLLPIGGRGNGPGQFSIPAGVAVRGDTIYIVDSFNRRVQEIRRVF